MYVIDILLLQKTVSGENFIALNFWYVNLKNGREKISFH